MWRRLACPGSLGVIVADNRARTVSFFEALRQASRQDGVAVLIDFSNLTTISPSGAILLIAELHRAGEDPEKRRVLSGTRARDPVIDQVLKQIGIYDHLGVNCSIKTEHETVKHWRVATGTLSDGPKGGSVIESYDGRLADGITRGLYDGIVEAMTNTLHHAYIGTEGKLLRHGIGRRWWMLSQEKDGRLSVAICDLGIGIARSLRHSGSFSEGAIRGMWTKLGLVRSDGNAIKVAIELGRTRTNQKGRGKGLCEIVDAVNLSADGVVLISSNKGVLRSTAHDVSTATNSHSIHGTLVVWSVPIANEASDGGNKND